MYLASHSTWEQLSRGYDNDKIDNPKIFLGGINSVRK